MAEFFFETWPDGTGPNIVQFGLLFLGSVAGIRAIDDLKAWIATRAEARDRSNLPT